MPDPAPRMVTNWCHRAEGNPAAPCTCGMCDRPATDPALQRGDWSLYGWAAAVFAVAAARGLVRRLRLRVGAALIGLGARIMGAGT